MDSSEHIERLHREGTGSKFMSDLLEKVERVQADCLAVINYYDEDPDFFDPTLANLARARVSTEILLARIDSLLHAFC